jgi:Ca2+-binding RTX toxin-like protein
MPSNIVALGSDFKVNASPFGSPIPAVLADVTALSSGQVLFTWSSLDSRDGSGASIVGAIMSAGGLLGPEFLINTSAEGGQFQPTTVQLSNGNLLLAWDSADVQDGSSSCIRVRTLGPTGAPLSGGGTGLSDFVANSTTSGAQIKVSIASMLDGRQFLTWQSGDTGDGSSGCIRGRILGAVGTPSGADFIVNSTATSNQTDPQIVALSDGRLFCSWVSADPGDGSGTCVRGRFFSSSGTAIANDFIVNSTGTGAQSTVALTAMTGGRVLALWQSSDPGDGSGTCLRGRIFNSAGSGTSADFIVPSTFAGDQSNPAATLMADGRVFMSWVSSDLGDGSLGCIRGAILNSDGSFFNNDFIVNSTVFGSVETPSVTALADGRVVVEWTDTSISQVRARIFGPDSNQYGTAANNVLSGTAANNSLFGFEGDDAFFASGGTDQVFGGIGFDRILMSGNLSDYFSSKTGDVTTLTDRRAGAPDGTVSLTDVEEVRFADVVADISLLADFGVKIVGTAGADTISLTQGLVRPGAHNDLIFAGAGNDKIDGSAGADWMYGGEGNDLYTVDNVNDRTIEGVDEGKDTVKSSVTYQIDDNIEGLTLIGGEAINGTGNAGDNTITGNNANNRLSGGDGNDILNGGIGDDVLIGGIGTDTMTGGTGADRFVFAALSDFGQTKLDTIKDFSSAQLDKIDLSLIDANGIQSGDASFKFLGTSAFNNVAGEVRIVARAGGISLKGDVDGDGVADFSVILTGVTSLSASDLIL